MPRRYTKRGLTGASSRRATLAAYNNKPERIETMAEYYRGRSEQIKMNVNQHRYPRRYGLSYDTVLQMNEERGGLCDVCGQPNNDGKRLHVDHDHATGKVRGMLCRNCNIGIGHLRDSPEILRLSAEYIERTR